MRWEKNLKSIGERKFKCFNFKADYRPSTKAKHGPNKTFGFEHRTNKQNFKTEKKTNILRENWRINCPLFKYFSCVLFNAKSANGEKVYVCDEKSAIFRLNPAP